MARFPKILLGLFVAVGLTVAGCNGAPPVDLAEPPATESAPTPEDTAPDPNGAADPVDKAETAPESVEEKPEPTAAQPNGTAEKEPKMMAVSIYVMDDSCSKFQPESVQVPADTAMTEAVGKVLERHDFNAFKLSGYRVNVENNTATVDLRLSEESERQFLSLTSCEQQGLFGGLEETLKQHPDWQVDQVEFTNRGKEILL